MDLNISENVYGYEITEPEITQNNPIFRMSNYGMEYKIEITVTLNAKPDKDRIVFVIASGKGTILNQILRILYLKPRVGPTGFLQSDDDAKLKIDEF